MPDRTSVFQDTIEDAFLDETVPTSNDGAGTKLRLGYITGKASGEYRVWMREDLTTGTAKTGRLIPANATILSATLRIVSSTQTGIGNVPVQARRLATPGTLEAECSWNLPFGLASQGWLGGEFYAVPTPIDAFTLPAATGEVLVDVTNTVRDAVANRSGIWEVLLSITGIPSASAYSYFHSTNAVPFFAASRPKLTIEWQPNVDTATEAYGPLIHAQTRLQRHVGQRRI